MNRLTAALTLIGLLVLSLAAGCASRPDGRLLAKVRGDDWIELTSGEWLRGRIKSMKQFSLDFDSDKLKDLSIDWEDIKTLRTAKASCLIGDKKIVVGQLTVDEKYATIADNGETLRLPRAELQSFSPGDLSERNYWSGNIQIGSTYRTGNTNQLDLTAQADLQRRTPDSTLELTYLGNYGKAEDVVTSNNDRVGITYDRTLTRQLFVRPFLGQYYHDPLVNIEHQATVSAGVGYYIFEEPHLEWQMFLGPAYQYTRFNTTETGQSSDNTTPGGLFSSRFEKKLTQRLDLLVTYQGILTSKDAGLFTQHAVGTLEFKITHLLNLDLSLIWDRTEHPQPGSSGHTPSRNDFETVLSLGVRF